MGRYRKKPVVIEAIQYLPHDNCYEVHNFIRGGIPWDEPCTERENNEWAIDTLEGTMWAQPGDWIIKGVQGEFYPCKPDIFAATYDEVE